MFRSGNNNIDPIKKRRILRISVIILLFVAYVMSCYVVITKYAVKNEAAIAKDLSATIALNQDKAASVKTVSLPIPDSDCCVEWECGTYYSNISMKSLQDYLTSLVEAGWRESKERSSNIQLKEGTTSYDLVKDDHLLQVIIYLKDPKVAICNSVLVYYDEAISVKESTNREDTLTKEEAMALIQPKVTELSKQGTIPYTKDAVTGLFEIEIKDSYDILQVQSFAAISDYGFSGCFLIRKGVVSYVPGNLSNACVYNIDGDDNYELIDAYDFYKNNLFLLHLVAYEYTNPIYFNSLTEILQLKCDNGYVYAKGYEKLNLSKTEDNRLVLTGETKEYGSVEWKGKTLVITGDKDNSLLSWIDNYDQKKLLTIDKTIPTAPPKIEILLDQHKLNYVVEKTVWAGETIAFSTADILSSIKKEKQFIPTISFEHTISGESDRSIILDFGSHMPDSIKVYDAMLDDKGNIRYGDKLITEQTVRILDDNRVEFQLNQHMAYYLSSNSKDYERDWRRLFRIECNWGENQGTYAFLLNTGRHEQLVDNKDKDTSLEEKVPDLDFLDCKGSYSLLSSTWGLGIDLTLDPEVLPNAYYIEWRVSDGHLRSWDDTRKLAEDIANQHNGYPLTCSSDGNAGEVIWTPDLFDEKDVVITAYLYEVDENMLENENNVYVLPEDATPVAYSKLTLQGSKGRYRKK